MRQKNKQYQFFSILVRIYFFKVFRWKDGKVCLEYDWHKNMDQK